MSLLSLLAGGIPQPRFNAGAIGTAHLVERHADVAGTSTELPVPVTGQMRPDGPCLVITLATDQRVEMRGPELLAFLSDVSGVDLAALLGQLGALV